MYVPWCVITPVRVRHDSGQSSQPPCPTGEAHPSLYEILGVDGVYQRREGQVRENSLSQSFPSVIALYIIDR